MSTHLVKRLRYYGHPGLTHEQQLMTEAADEIERLERELDKAKQPARRGW